MSHHESEPEVSVSVISKAQRTFVSWFTDVLIYLVVIGLFQQYVEEIHIPSFTIMLLVAIAMKVLLVIVGRLEHAVHGYFEERGLELVASIAALITLFLGKLGLLKVVELLFPEVHLGHFVTELLLILSMILAVVVVHKIYQALGPDILEDTLI